MGWTTEQQQAIDARGGTLLVSAAAGSGKTAVLIERIVKRIIDPVDPVDVNELLVVTFTRAAAAEMKQRLSKGLSEAVKTGAEDPRHLIHQQMLLPTADITTVDGFCQKLVRDHVADLRDDSVRVDFKVAEESQTALMKYDALDEAMAHAYEEKSAAFRALSDALNKKDDAPLQNVVLKLHGFMQVLPDRHAFVQAQNDALNPATPFEQTAFGQTLLTYMRDLVEQQRDLLLQLDALAYPEVAQNEENPPFYKLALRSIEAAGDVIFAPDSSLDEKIDALRHVEHPNFDNRNVGGIPKNFPAENSNVAHALYARATELYKDGNELTAYSERTLEEERRCVAPMIGALLAIVEDFEACYAAKKQEAGVLDYNDLEHKALELLAARDDNGTFLRDEAGRLVQSELAKELSASYREIYVDEYQDTNELQDALYRLLSQNEQNLFFVGDAKQSIYGFRRTSPEAFIKRRESYAPYENGATAPSYLLLGHNFRSRKTVTDAVNTLFSRLMQKESGGIAYADGEQLVYACPDYAADDTHLFDPALLLVDLANDPNDTDETAQDVGKYALEADVIAKEIKKLMHTASVTEKGGATRPVAYRDFCILLRSCKGRDHLYANELIARGIPAVTGNGDGNFFDATEIGWILSLLRFIDNPLLDVSLLAVLMSPLCGFSPDDVAQLHLCGTHASLYTALRTVAAEPTTLGERCSAFLKQTDEWRVLAATVPVDALLWNIYEKTDLPALCAIHQNGAARERNLQLLLEHARNFEQNGFCGLSAFLRFFDRLQERGQEMKTAALSATQDAVHVMTIHRSKGLEFPFVFVANVGTKFNDQDANAKVIVHDKAGIGMKWTNDDTLETHDTLMRQGVRRAILRDQRAEELRLLYVAATRAREKLFFTGTFKNLPAALDKGAICLRENDTVCASAVLNADSYATWIFASLLSHPDADCLRNAATLAPKTVREDDVSWDIRIFKKAALEAAEAAEETVEFPVSDETLKAQLRERFSYTYPHKELTAVPSKLAASAVAHPTHTHEYAATSVPAFLRKEGLTAAEKGTATHAFMQHADWKNATDDVEAEKERLVAEGKLTVEQADAIDVAQIAAFFAHPLHKRLAAADRLWKELPFTYALSVGDYKALTGIKLATSPEDDEAETLLVQGIADCVFEENGNLVILDYKTDRGKSMEQLRDHYAPQLKLYAKALAETLGKPVASCLIYSFAHNDLIEVGVEI